MKPFLKYLLTLMILVHGADSYALGFQVLRDTACTGSPYLFKDTSTPPSGLTIVSRSWNFADPLSAGGPTLTTVDSVFHNYLSVGLVSPSMTLTYSDNSTVTYTIPNPILVVKSPTAGYSVDRPITCPGVPITFTASNAAGASSIVNYNLDLADGSPSSLFVDGTPIVYNYSIIKKYNTIYTVSDLNGCQDTASIVITILPYPKIKFEPITLSCKDSAVVYENRTTNIGQFVKWDWLFFDSVSHPLPRSGSGVNFTYTWNKAGPQKVFLTGTTATGCIVTDSIIAAVDTTPELVLSLKKDTTICFGESVELKTLGSDTIFYSSELWMNRISGDSIVLFTPKNTYTYTVYGKTKNCPKTGKDIKINVVQPMLIPLSLTPNNILRGDQSILQVKPNAVFDSLKWTPSNSIACSTCDSTGASPQISTMYKVQVFYSMFDFPCQIEDSFYLKVDLACTIDSLKIPSAFTPNGDNINNEFYVKSRLLNNVIAMDIYNRWGNRVFNVSNVAPNNPLNGWNGKLNNAGEDLPPGMYVYNISATCLNGQTLNFQGEINLIR